MASIIKVDSLQEKTSGNGIVLENSLKDSTGTNEIISPSGGITIPSGQSIKNSSGTEIMSSAGALTGAIFPAGHIIQSVFNPTVTNISTATGTTVDYATINGQITIQNGNAILIYVHNYAVATVNTNAIIGHSILKENYASLGSYYSGNSGNAGNHYMNISQWALDSNPDSTSPNYILRLNTGSGGTSNVYQPQTETGITFKVWLFEVQQ